MGPGPHLCAGREQMASQLPQSSLGTGNVWTQMMNGLNGRVATRAVPVGLELGYPIQEFGGGVKILFLMWNWD